MREIMLILILIPKKALLILQNKAVSTSNLQLLAQRRKVFCGLLTCALQAISIILRH
jgi:hypothetical protein